MLSYQHIYHAGNMADVQKHALLSWVLAYMTKKDKPLSYMETHAGRGLYELDSAEAVKTGEAKAGIDIAEKLGWFDADHPYAQALAGVRAKYGANTYPGSPLIASELLRAEDSLRLAELHPRENEALREVLGNLSVIEKRDGAEMANALCPPNPRRGVLLIDPSYEMKTDYDAMARLIQTVHRKWNVGVIMLWYPILTDGLHRPMIRALEQAITDGAKHEVRFPPAREGHRMVGSGMFVVNAPYGLSDEMARLTKLYNALS